MVVYSLYIQKKSLECGLWSGKILRLLLTAIWWTISRRGINKMLWTTKEMPRWRDCNVSSIFRGIFYCCTCLRERDIWRRNGRRVYGCCFGVFVSLWKYNWNYIYNKIRATVRKEGHPQDRMDVEKRKLSNKSWFRKVHRLQPAVFDVLTDVVDAAQLSVFVVIVLADKCEGRFLQHSYPSKEKHEGNIYYTWWRNLSSF